MVTVWRTSSSQTNFAPACLDRLDDVGEVGLLDEGARGDDRADGCGADRGRDAGRAGRVVDHRRNAARRLQAEERDRDAVGVGQHQADGLAGLADAREAAASTRAAMNSRL